MVLLRVQRVSADVARGHVLTGGVAGSAGERQGGRGPGEKGRAGQKVAEGRLHLHAQTAGRKMLRHMSCLYSKPV